MQSNLTHMTNALLPVIMNNPPIVGGSNPAYAAPAQQNQNQYYQQQYQQPQVQYQGYQQYTKQQNPGFQQQQASDERRNTMDQFYQASLSPQEVCTKVDQFSEKYTKETTTAC